MTAQNRPSARQGNRKDPVLFPTRDTPRTAPPRQPVEMDTDRPRLGAGLLVPVSAGYRRLRAARTALTPRQIIADPDIMSVLLVSVALHALLFAVAAWLAAHHQPRGNPQAEATGAVDMMFVTPPAESGMKGEHSDDAAGGNQAAQSSQSSESQPEQAEDSEGATRPTAETPAAPPVPEASSNENFPKPTNEAAPITPAANHTGQGSRKTTKQAPHRQSMQHAQRPQHAPSPFDSLTNLSLDQSSAPPRAKRQGRTGGSGGPIDLSIGPMVSNGKLNAPYATRTTTRGVSDDYSEDVDRWIRRHMYYPEEAAENGEEGPSSVHVVIDRSGRVRFVRLTNQSGSYLLDAATTGMFRAAQLPPVPPNVPGDHFDLDVTINYILIRR
ncbi:TonB periplasmic protein [Acetobacter estunensis NRIC 0472]|uniref:TonB family protein n=1 Tax=Acetobacter estunensis TaxID=104097 RepID=A0A967B4R1_9PROT|nr:TonB family protein [Acetobacter estunensis]NHO53159.1 TonB family protein [Acetobacter estunensis]GBQ24889.1 TonB periplasmic protein [Acetobacter estunensis NRIC 0472]